MVGPEQPLVDGVHDFFLGDPELKTVPVIGPCRLAAQLEGSKDFAKAFMARHAIPTASYATFTAETLDEGRAFLRTLNPPFVLKADGLAAGKGVLILDSREEAEEELRLMLTESKFGKASEKVVVEQFLKGIELSVFVLTDGISYKILPSAKDYKRIGEGDTGLNTGGMGAVSPVPFADAAFMEKVEQRIVKPTIQGLAQDAIPYQGFVFIGLMNVDGDPYVIEYNVRMGDPETEVVLPRIQSDLLDLFEGVAQGRLAEKSFSVDPRYACCVMMVAQGYPGDYAKGDILTYTPLPEALIFHAGTQTDAAQNVRTAGGRVMAVTCLSSELPLAMKAALNQADAVCFDGKKYRHDIGRDLLSYVPSVQ